MRIGRVAFFVADPSHFRFEKRAVAVRTLDQRGDVVSAGVNSHASTSRSIAIGIRSHDATINFMVAHVLGSTVAPVSVGLRHAASC